MTLIVVLVVLCVYGVGLNLWLFRGPKKAQRTIKPARRAATTPPAGIAYQEIIQKSAMDSSDNHKA